MTLNIINNLNKVHSYDHRYKIIWFYIEMKNGQIIHKINNENKQKCRLQIMEIGRFCNCSVRTLSILILKLKQ